MTHEEVSVFLCRSWKVFNFSQICCTEIRILELCFSLYGFTCHFICKCIMLLRNLETLFSTNRTYHWKLQIIFNVWLILRTSELRTWDFLCHLLVPMQLNGQNLKSEVKYALLCFSFTLQLIALDWKYFKISVNVKFQWHSVCLDILPGLL